MKDCTLESVKRYLNPQADTAIDANIEDLIVELGLELEIEQL